MNPLKDKQTRQDSLQLWAVESLVKLGHQVPEDFRIESASDDASFRRYFRAELAPDVSYIFVDAPPDKEDNPAFVSVCQQLASAQVPVPKIYRSDIKAGFLMLSDLGTQLLLPLLEAGSLEDQAGWYETAIQELEKIQTAEYDGVAAYSHEKLNEEMGLFPDWFIKQQLGLEITGEAQRVFEEVRQIMLRNVDEQPVVFVHRDYHARNIMVSDQKQLSIIDFQDAVAGPISYDLVSLLKDCYFRLPRETLVTLVEGFRQRNQSEVSTETFLRWFDLMGFQRHLKCAGIFSRLNLRDGKPGYLKDIPLVLSYLQEVCALYPELAPFGDWLTSTVLPVAQNKLSAA